MAFRARTFYIDKNQQGVLSEVTTTLFRSIGLEGGFLSELNLVNFGGGILQLNVIYRTEYDRSVLSTYPPPGAIVELGNEFDHASFLFSREVDGSTLSGSFSFDGAFEGANSIDDWYLEPGGNIAQVQLPTVVRSGSGHHIVEVDSSLLKYRDSESLQHSSLLAYNMHAQTAPFAGEAQPYTASLSKRGLVEVQGLRIDKSNLPSERINSYLEELGITEDRLIHFSSVDISGSLVYVVFAYFKTLEPFLVQAYPYNHSVFIFGSNTQDLSAVFVFLEGVDSAYVTNTDGLFKVCTGFAQFTSVSASDVTVDDDLKTVRVNLQSIINSYGEGVYDFRISGLIGADGTRQTRDILYSLQVLGYFPQISVASGSVVSGNFATIAQYEYLSGEHSALSDSASSHETSEANPHLVTFTQVGAPSTDNYDYLSGIVLSLSGYTTGLFETLTGHTGDSSIHFTTGQIDHGKIGGLEGDDHTGYLTTNPAVDIRNRISVDGVIALSIDGPAGGGNGEFLQQWTPDTDVPSELAYVDDQGRIHALGFDAQNNQINNVASPSAAADAVNLLTFSGHTGDTANPHNVTAAQVGSPTTSAYNYLSGKHTALSGTVTGHTGDTTVHFTTGAIDHNKIANLGVGDLHTQYLVTSPNSSARNTISPADDYICLSIFAMETQTENLLDVWNNSPSLVSYFDSSAALFLTTTPTNANHATNKTYVDTAITAATGDLLNISDIDVARQSLGVSYGMEDFTPYIPAFWSSLADGVGSRYQVNPHYETWHQSGDVEGILGTSAGNTTGTGNSCMSYASQRGFFMDTGSIYYYRIGFSHDAECDYRFGLCESQPSNSNLNPEDGAWFRFYETGDSNTFLTVYTSDASTESGLLTSMSVSKDVWYWFGIEPRQPDVHFYFFDGSSPPATIIITGNHPQDTLRNVRPFFQSINQAGAFRIVHCDKFMYSIPHSSLSGVAQ